MAKNHVMIDCETLSTQTDATILTLGAVKFDPYADPDSPENDLTDTLYLKIDLDSSAALDLHIDDGTIEWWSRQSQAAQDAAFDPAGRITINDAFSQLHRFCLNAQGVWSNGAVFDIVICETIFKKLKRSPPWKYYNIRDTRTIWDLGIDPALPQVTAHDALADSIAQAIGVQRVVCGLVKLGITPFSKQK